MSVRIGGQLSLPGDEPGRFPPLATSQGPPQVPQEELTPTAVSAAVDIDAFIDADDGLFSRVTGVFQNAFGLLASAADEFHGLIETVFGAGYDREVAEELRLQSVEGEFAWLPPIELLDNETLQAANGAFDAEDEVVFLNETLRVDVPLAAETYVEEVGHFLDLRLNTEDSAGDEGELFRRLLLGEELSDVQIAEIRKEDDTGTITVDGRARRVEFWAAKAVYTRAQRYGDQIRYVVKWVLDPRKDAIERGRKRRRMLERLIKALRLSATHARLSENARSSADKRSG